MGTGVPDVYVCCPTAGLVEPLPVTAMVRVYWTGGIGGPPTKLAMTVTFWGGMVKVVVAEVALVNEPAVAVQWEKE
jgi:hypothetical protein